MSPCVIPLYPALTPKLHCWGTYPHFYNSGIKAGEWQWGREKKKTPNPPKKPKTKDVWGLSFILIILLLLHGVLLSLSKWMTTIWPTLSELHSTVTGKLSEALHSLLSEEKSSGGRVEDPSPLSLFVSGTRATAMGSWQVISTITITPITGVINNSPKAWQ